MFRSVRNRLWVILVGQVLDRFWTFPARSPDLRDAGCGSSCGSAEVSVLGIPRLALIAARHMLRIRLRISFGVGSGHSLPRGQTSETQVVD
jgi:hypothetical protein